VVIIGGGVIGCSVAYHLIKLGWRDVVLLERKDLTSGTTWHAAGLVVSGTIGSAVMSDMSKYTRELFHRLGEETGQDTGFRRIGYLELASTTEWVEAFRRAADFGRYNGHVIEELSPAEIKKQSIVSALRQRSAATTGSSFEANPSFHTPGAKWWPKLPQVKRLSWQPSTWTWFTTSTQVGPSHFGTEGSIATVV
jgi:glycine/D-amino acid oxidase-like deaminating enzyme